MDHSVSDSTLLMVTFAALIFGLFAGYIFGKAAGNKARSGEQKGAINPQAKKKVKLPAQTNDISSYPEAPPEVLALLPNQKIEAIKKYREMTGLGLKQSKDVIDATCQNLGKSRVRTNDASKFPDVPPEVLDLLPRKKIEALKKYCELTGLSLKESKDIIDEVCQKLGR